MSYEFIHTMHGPAVIGDDEVIFFNQIPLMVDYATEFPDFIAEAKSFVESQVKYLSDLAVKTLHEPVVGAEQMHTLPQYIFAIDQIHRTAFELNQPQDGFPGQNPF